MTHPVPPTLGLWYTRGFDQYLSVEIKTPISSPKILLNSFFLKKKNAQGYLWGSARGEGELEEGNPFHRQLNCWDWSRLKALDTLRTWVGVRWVRERGRPKI